jgi:enoyl-CoA hydratase
VDKVKVEQHDRTTVVSIARPDVRNAVDGETAAALAAAFREFDANPDADVAVLYGEYGTFCAGADLKAVSTGAGSNPLNEDGDGPMGQSRMVLG